MRLSHIGRGALSAENAWRRMQLTGFTPNGHPLWSRTETGNMLGNLINGHPDYKAILALNVHRTRPAHHNKAGRMGIARPKAPEWDANEISRLRRLFPRAEKQDVIDALPDRSWKAICRKAWSMHLCRPPRALRPTGDDLLDQILLRAQKMGISLRALDQDLGAAGYFARRKWRHATAPAFHLRAVAILGGRLRYRS